MFKTSAGEHLKYFILPLCLCPQRDLAPRVEVGGGHGGEPGAGHQAALQEVGEAETLEDAGQQLGREPGHVVHAAVGRVGGGAALSLGQLLRSNQSGNILFELVEIVQAFGFPHGPAPARWRFLQFVVADDAHAA